jgi:hypothetical protein
MHRCTADYILIHVTTLKLQLIVVLAVAKSRSPTLHMYRFNMVLVLFTFALFLSAVVQAGNAISQAQLAEGCAPGETSNSAEYSLGISAQRFEEVSVHRIGPGGTGRSRSCRNENTVKPKFNICFQMPRFRTENRSLHTLALAFRVAVCFDE